MNCYKRAEIRDINEIIRKAIEDLDKILVFEEMSLDNVEDMIEDEDTLEGKRKTNYKLRRSIELLYKAVLHLEDISEIYG